MKTNYMKYFIFIFFSALYYSCDSFLEEDAKGRIDSKYALTEEGAEKELLSLYQVNADMLDHMYMIGEMGNDLMLNGGNTRDYWRGLIRYEDRFLIDNSNNANYWKWLYVGVVNANISINSITKAVFSDDAHRKNLLSEAHALRAFYNLLLVETYGPAAHLTFDIVNTPNDVSVNQIGISGFYKAVFEDLNIADNNLSMPDIVRAREFGRMDLGIAKMIRLRALMSLGSYDDSMIAAAGQSNKKQCYQDAANLSDKLIKEYGYKLEDKYENVFSESHEQSKEIIWSIQYNNSIYSSNNNYIFRYWTPYFNRSLNSGNIKGLPSHAVYYGREYRTFLPTLYFIQAFDKTDKRRAATFDWVWCRIDESNDPIGAKPIFSDTLLIRSLDVLPANIKQAYRARGIACDDVADIYNLNTGVPTSINARSCFNSVRKWQDITRLAAKQEYAFRDAILMRLGEVYITQAEAYIQLGETDKAAQVITELRKRAVTPGHKDQLKVNSGDMTLKFILDEGTRELGAELYRWYMVKRALSPANWVKWMREHNPDTHELDTDVAGIKEYHYYRPVPKSTIDDYKALGLEFKQNNGYPNM